MQLRAFKTGSDLLARTCQGLVNVCETFLCTYDGLTFLSAKIHPPGPFLARVAIVAETWLTRQLEKKTARKVFPRRRKRALWGAAAAFGISKLDRPSVKPWGEKVIIPVHPDVLRESRWKLYS